MPMHIRTRRPAPLPAGWTFTDFMLAEGLSGPERKIGYAAQDGLMLSFEAYKPAEHALAATYLHARGASLIPALSPLLGMLADGAPAILGQLPRLGRTWEPEVGQLQAALRNQPGRHGWQVFAVPGTLCCLAHTYEPGEHALQVAIAEARKVFRLYLTCTGTLTLEKTL